MSLLEMTGRLLLVAAFWLLVVPLVALLQRRASGATRRAAPSSDRRDRPEGWRVVARWEILVPVADLLKLAAKSRPASASRTDISPLHGRPGLRGGAARGDVVARAGPLLALGSIVLALSAIPVGRLLAVGDSCPGLLLALIAPLAASIGIAVSTRDGASGAAGGPFRGAPTPEALFPLVLALSLAAAAASASAGTLSLAGVTNAQSSLFDWMIFRQPLAFAIYVGAAWSLGHGISLDPTRPRAEAGGGGLPDCGGLRLALWILVEYLTLALLAALAVTLYLGGPSPGFPLPAGLLGDGLGAAAFLAKLLAVAYALLLLRWRRPALRQRDAARFAWKGLIPAGLVNIVLTGAVVTIYDALGG